MTIADDVATVVTALKAAGLSRSDSRPLTVIGHDALPGTLDKPECVGVTFDGMDETEVGVTVALYCDTSADVPAAEAARQRLVPALDAALDATPAPRSTWRKSWSVDLSAYVDETTLRFPRDDF